MSLMLLSSALHDVALLRWQVLTRDSAVSFIHTILAMVISAKSAIQPCRLCFHPTTLDLSKLLGGKANNRFDNIS
jgi:hypothetical protein